MDKIWSAFSDFSFVVFEDKQYGFLNINVMFCIFLHYIIVVEPKY